MCRVTTEIMQVGEYQNYQSINLKYGHQIKRYETTKGESWFLESKTFGIYLHYSHLILPFKSLLCPRPFLLCAETISAHNTTCIPCAILELSGTIPESVDKVGIPILRRTIPELSRFLLCAEHIY